jgi:type IV secretion system protein VirD4
MKCNFDYFYGAQADQFSFIRIPLVILTEIPYAVAGLLATNFGEAWRLTAGVDPSRKVLTLMTTLQTAFANPLPSFHPFDLMIGVICALVFYLAVYMRGKNAKKYRHNTEYGSARWGAYYQL